MPCEFLRTELRLMLSAVTSCYTLNDYFFICIQQQQYYQYHFLLSPVYKLYCVFTAAPLTYFIFSFPNDLIWKPQGDCKICMECCQRSNLRKSYLYERQTTDGAVKVSSCPYSCNQICNIINNKGYQWKLLYKNEY